MLKPVLAAGLALALCACASEPRREVRRGHGGPPPGGAEMRFRRLFISPSGEPFRGEGGLARWFGGADTDHDGAVTLAEFQADAVRFFRRLDADGNGVIDGFEMRAYEEAIAPEVAANDFDRPQGERGEAGVGERRQGPPGGGMGRRGGRGGRRMGGNPPGAGRGGGFGGGREGAARYSLINEPEPVTNADENVDGRVTAAEWSHATARRFAVLDKSRTGRLTLEGLLGRPTAPH